MSTTASTCGHIATSQRHPLAYIENNRLRALIKIWHEKYFLLCFIFSKDLWMISISWNFLLNRSKNGFSRAIFQFWPILAPKIVFFAQNYNLGGPISKIFRISNLLDSTYLWTKFGQEIRLCICWLRHPWADHNVLSAQFSNKLLFSYKHFIWKFIKSYSIMKII